MTHSSTTCLIHPFSKQSDTTAHKNKCILLLLNFFPWYRIWMHGIWAICDMSHTPVTWVPQVRHDFMCDMTYSYVTWLIHVYNTIYLRATSLIHARHDPFMRDRTLSCATDSFICDMIHLCMTRRIHAWYDPFMCNMSHWCVTDSFIPYMYPYDADK